MERNQSFVSAHDLEVLQAKSKRELFRDVIEADRNGVKHDLVNYLSAYLTSGGYTLKIEKGETPDPNKLLIIAPNHHSRQRFFTTEESLRTVAIASVSARQEEVSEKHISWMIRKLPVPPVGIGKMARQVQNATGTVFDSLPAKTVRKLSLRGVIPKFKETMTPQDANSLISGVVERVTRGNALGIFPEQEPSYQLKPYHRNFTRTLETLKLLSSDYQIATLSCFYEGNIAWAVYGPTISVTEATNVHEAATQVMQGIAKGMPKNLRGHYA